MACNNTTLILLKAHKLTPSDVFKSFRKSLKRREIESNSDLDEKDRVSKVLRVKSIGATESVTAPLPIKENTRKRNTLLLNGIEKGLTDPRGAQGFHWAKVV
jgi:hypothetical protein